MAGPTGWLHDPAEVSAVLATLPLPHFDDAAPDLSGTGAGKTVLLYKAWKDVLGGAYPDYPAQGIGDCVSQGFGHGVDLLAAVEIALGHQAEEFKPTCTEAIYGMARVDIGKQKGSYDDGAVGAWGAQAVAKLGTVSRELAGGGYIPERAKDWGARGVPDRITQAAKDHRIGATSLVRTYGELEDALANGYPVPVCSYQGFTETRDAQGFCRPRGEWAHCLLPGTLVSTKVPKPIENLEVGDYVISHDGTLNPVTELFIRDYRGDLITLSTCGNTDVRYTDEHPLFVLREGQEKPDWLPARDVRVGDYLLSPTALPRYAGDGLPKWDRSQGPNQPLDITDYHPHLAWMFGYYIANGNLRLNHGIAFTIPRAKSSIADGLVFAFEKIGLKARVIESETHLRVVVDSVTVERSFRAWFGDNSLSKRIPAFLYGGDWNHRSLLGGLYDGDGGARPNGELYFDTISPVLARQVWQIRLSQGYHVMMNATRADRPGAYENAKPGFRIRYIPFRKKRAPTKFIDGHYAMPVKSVLRTAYVGKVYNCEVEHTHSYVADGVTSHNCMLIVGIRNDDRPGACILNSWYPKSPKGPLALDQPPASFWADRDVVDRMLAMRDSWSISNFQGYERRELPDRWKYTGFA